MSLLPSSVLCWVLDEAYDHYVAVWELASIFRRRLPQLAEDEVHEQLRQGLDELQRQGYVSFWEGVHFSSEEEPVIPELTAAFIATQANDWKNLDWSVKQVKLYITDSGRAYYHAHCDSSFFTGTG